MNKLTSIILLVTLICSTNTFAASSFALLLRDFHIAVRVHNKPVENEIKKLTQKIIDQKISKKEITDFLKARLDKNTYKDLLAIINTEEQRLSDSTTESSQELQYILEEVMQTTDINTGANFSAATLGFDALGAGVIAGGIVFVVKGPRIQYFNPLVGENMDMAASIAGVMISLGISLIVVGHLKY